MAQRTNEEWLSELRGPQRDEALADLRRILLRGLRVALSSKGRLSDDDLDDFVQDALLRILDALDSFRGEARFTTWAYKIAIHVALSELRRRRWRDVPLEDLAPESDGLYVPDTIVDPNVDPEQQAIQRDVLRTLRQAISHDLTEKQRKALVAARVHGMPLDEIARRMDTNRNALYKLLFDARQRLQKSLLARGLPSDDILSAFGLPSEVRATQRNTSMKAEGSR